MLGLLSAIAGTFSVVADTSGAVIGTSAYVVGTSIAYSVVTCVNIACCCVRLTKTPFEKTVVCELIDDYFVITPFEI